MQRRRFQQRSNMFSKHGMLARLFRCRCTRAAMTCLYLVLFVPYFVSLSSMSLFFFSRVSFIWHRCTSTFIFSDRRLPSFSFIPFILYLLSYTFSGAFSHVQRSQYDFLRTGRIVQLFRLAPDVPFVTSVCTLLDLPSGTSASGVSDGGACDGAERSKAGAGDQSFPTFQVSSR